MVILFFIVFFVLIGHWLSYYFLKQKNLSFGLVSIFLLGLSFILITGYIFSLLKILDYYFYFLIFSALILGLIVTKKFNFDEWEFNDRKYTFILVLISLVCSLFLILPHYSYPWPIHADEWWQAGIAKNLKENLSINSHPYFFNYFFNLKPALGVITGIVEKFKIDILENWYIFVFLNNFFIFFIISTLIRNYVGNFSLLLPVILTSLKSNVYFLGWWFFIPSTFGLIYFWPSILINDDNFKNTKILKIIFLITLTLIYPPYAFLILFIFLIDYLIKSFFQRKFLFLIFFLFLIILFLVFSSYSPYQAYFEKKNIFGAILVPVKATTHFVELVNIFDVVPVIIFLLGAVAFFINFPNYLKILFVFSVINLNIILLTKHSLFLFHQRHYQLLGILLSLGSLWVFNHFKYLIHNKLIKILLMIVILILAFVNYDKIPYGTNIYYLIDENNLPVLNWLKMQNSKKIVLAHPALGTVISPYSRLISPISLLSLQIINKNFNEELNFENLSCEEKRKVIERHGINLVIVLSKQNCQFLREVQNINGYLIYEFNDSTIKSAN